MRRRQQSAVVEPAASPALTPVEPTKKRLKSGASTPQEVHSPAEKVPTEDESVQAEQTPRDDAEYAKVTEAYQPMNAVLGAIHRNRNTKAEKK
eukprot:Trichotokara_eunicae@DN5798_c0_g1_i4.p1